MNIVRRLLACGALSVALALLVTAPLRAAKDDVPTPKEYGVYVKTTKGMVRILTNLVFEEGGMIYLESNNPARFQLNDLNYFIVYGKYDIRYVTLNNLLFLNQSPVGKPRFMFGKELEVEVKKRGDGLYTVKPKGLFGRGYYGLWINDEVWDIIIQ
jgi:hypothetical protein